MPGKPAAQICLEILSRLSLGNLNRLADFFAFLLGLFPNQLSRMTRANVCLCFSTYSAGQKQQLRRASLRHTCRSFVELAAVWCWPTEQLLASCEDSGISAAYRKSTRGKIIIAPHLGSWEVLNIWLAAQGPLMSLYKARKKQPALNQFMVDARSRNGAHLVSTKTGGLRTLLKGLKDGAALMLLPDQRPSRRKAKVTSPFFGYPAPSSTLVHALAHRQDCDLFIAAAIRNPQNSGFTIRLQLLDRERISGDLQDSVDYMNQSIEQWVREIPEQYQWAYRRFTTKTYKVNACL